MLFSALAILSAAAAVSAAPTARTVNPTCASLGPSAFDTAYNFTLAAYNVTGLNANDTGAPLVLGQAGAIDGAEFKVFSTYASYPYNDFPTLSLIHNGLWGNATDGYNAQGGAPTAGQEISFIVPPQSNIPPSTFCGVAGTSAAHGSFPQLAVNGSTTDFWLCPTGTSATSQVNIVYKPTANNYGAYIFDECYNVILHMVGLD